MGSALKDVSISLSGMSSISTSIVFILLSFISLEGEFDFNF